ncbi:hypothetical protein N0V85_009102 [Neurospora sp. IMI 360204]|nr:hypothetical protein N0V85_009102 [Neurospora sp. IMI 360204]
MDRMSIREREEWQRQLDTIREQHEARIMEQLLTVEPKYTDANGRWLDTKEAFKEMSHQFHGKGSGNGKTDKQLKKREVERDGRSRALVVVVVVIFNVYFRLPARRMECPMQLVPIDPDWTWLAANPGPETGPHRRTLPTAVSNIRRTSS